MIQKIVLLLYLTLLIELLFIHIPSVANTSFLLNAKNEIYFNKFNKIFKWSFFEKVIYLIIPHLLNVISFFLPLGFIFYKLEDDQSFSIIALGSMIAIIGRVSTIMAAMNLKKAISENKINDEQFFKYSRNPINLGLYIFYLGLCIIIGKPVLLIGWVVIIFYNHFRILMEEDYLLKNNKEYLIYFDKVPRYIAFK